MATNNRMLRSQIDGARFTHLWNQPSGLPHLQNLMCEMLTRKDLELANPKKFFLPISHLGARVLSYYLGLEEQLSTKRRLDQTTDEVRLVRLPDYGAELLN